MPPPLCLRQCPIGDNMDTMSPYTTILAYFGLYLLFMLIFFIILCLVCVCVLLWYYRKHNQEFVSSTREDTPIRRPCQNDF